MTTKSDKRFVELVKLFDRETPFLLSVDERAKWAAMHRVFEAVAVLDRNSPSQNDLDDRRLTNADLMARSLEIERLWDESDRTGRVVRPIGRKT